MQHKYKRLDMSEKLAIVLQYKKSTKRDESEKLALVDSFLASGLPMKTFADSEGINHSTFRYWVRKYREGTLSK